MTGVTNEFRLVTRKRRSRRGGRANGVAADSSSRMPEDEDAEADVLVDQEAVLRKVFEAEAELSGSLFGENVLDKLDESLNALSQTRIGEIVCYGLGRFSRQYSSKYQLALLMSVKRRFGSVAHVYDPAFLRSEISMLRRLGLLPIERNEEGKRELSSGPPPTLVYMPHCSTHLINNLLYANWGPNLCNCLLLGNSLSIVTECRASGSPALPPSMDYVSRVLPYVTEFPLRNQFSYEEAFNDFSVHAFLKRDLDSAEPEIWTLREPPDYRNLCVEYITAEQSAASTTRLNENRSSA